MKVRDNRDRTYPLPATVFLTAKSIHRLAKGINLLTTRYPLLTTVLFPRNTRSTRKWEWSSRITRKNASRDLSIENALWLNNQVRIYLSHLTKSHGIPLDVSIIELTFYL